MTEAKVLSWMELRNDQRHLVCAFTTDRTEAPLLRLAVQPSARNGLRQPSRLMVDKITTMAKAKPGTRVGWLKDEHMRRLDRAMLVFLGLAGSPRAGRASTQP